MSTFSVVRAFRAMKDYMVENQVLLPQHDCLRLPMRVSDSQQTVHAKMDDPDLEFVSESWRKMNIRVAMQPASSGTTRFLPLGPTTKRKSMRKQHRAEQEKKHYIEQFKKVERNEHTHRLCTREAYLETLLQESSAFSPDQNLRAPFTAYGAPSGLSAIVILL